MGRPACWCLPWRFLVHYMKFILLYKSKLVPHVMSRGAAPYPSRKFQWKNSTKHGGHFPPPDHSQFIAIQNFIRVFRGYRTAAPPQRGRMPSGMYRPGKRPVCGWRLRCAGSPSLHGHRENPKGIACTASPPPSLCRKPGNLLRGAPQRRPLIRPHGRTEENRQRNDPHTALTGGERAEHIIKLEI